MKLRLINNADGPTSVFYAGKLGLNWINFFGLIIILVIMIPNIIYAIKKREVDADYDNKFINGLEQIGRYGSMFFMAFNIGLLEFGFYSHGTFLIYAIGNIVLLILYLILWIPYFRRKTMWNGLLLAIIPACIFFMSGITLRHYFLVAVSIIFAVGHITITYKTHKKEKCL